MVLSCPDSQVLEHFLLGRVPEEDWNELAAHVELCSECIGRLRQLRVVDPLESALQGVRAGTRGPGRLVEQWILQKVVDQLSDADPESVSSGARTPPATLPDELLAETGSTPTYTAPPFHRLGHYRLFQVLGRGGMGMVFLAEDLQLRRPAAVKMMLPTLAQEPTYRERFLREARSAAKVESDFIVPIYHVDEDQGVPYLAMQLLRGETLEARVKRERVLPVRDVLRIGREIALGLAAAHEHGLIHRDIKPANVFLEGKAPADTGSGGGGAALAPGVAPGRCSRVRILDFGLARAVDGDTQISQSGPILGTPAYMAPEQANGDPIDARCDLFSLGCVLYHLATGTAPFKRPTLTATLIALVMHRPPAPIELNPKLPAALSQLIMELLAKKTAGRPASAHEVAARLADLEAHDLAETDGEPPRRRPPPVVLVTALSIVAAALVLLGSIIYVLTDTGSIGISTEDRDVQVRVEQDGRLVTILDPRSRETWRIDTGKYTVRLNGNPAGLEIALPDTFILKRGDHHVVSIRKTRPPSIVEKVQAVDPFQDAYQSVRDADAVFGKPTSAVQNGTAGATYRQYEHGQIIRPPASRTAFAIYGPIYDAYFALVDHGVKMGQPRGGIQGGSQGSLYMPFERGQIILPSNSRTAYAIHGPIYEAYIGVENHGAVFGRPLEGIRGGYQGAVYVRFEHGEVILPPHSRAAHVIYGPLHEAYRRLEGPAIQLGQPTSDVYKDGDIRRIDFERGWIEYDGRDRAKVHFN